MQTTVGLSFIVVNIVTAVALIIGGGWAYLQYIRGRTFKRRLQVGVSGQVRREHGILKILVDCRAENLGIRRFDVNSEGTAIRLLASRMDTPPLDEPLEGGWEVLGVWQAFAPASLELGESMDDAILLDLPDGGQSALRLELSVSLPSGESWRASDVVFLSEETDNQ